MVDHFQRWSITDIWG